MPAVVVDNADLPAVPMTQAEEHYECSSAFHSDETDTCIYPNKVENVALPVHAGLPKELPYFAFQI
jgi:hypothetical protein